MPLYEYQCNCGNGEDRFLPYSQFSEPQTCGCGEVMEHKMSRSSFVMKQTGSGMALDTLNSKQGMPNRHWKADAEKLAAAGI